MVRGIRGAITVKENSAEEIYRATQELLQELARANQFDRQDVISALFTVTPDLNAAFPATGAREIGWVDVPMMCGQEIPVAGALPGCIRVLLHVNTAREQVRHVYLRGAEKLRPDLL